MPRRQTHQGLKFPTENILTHTILSNMLYILLVLCYTLSVSLSCFARCGVCCCGLFFCLNATAPRTSRRASYAVPHLLSRISHRFDALFSSSMSLGCTRGGIPASPSPIAHHPAASTASPMVGQYRSSSSAVSPRRRSASQKISISSCIRVVSVKRLPPRTAPRFRRISTS